MTKKSMETRAFDRIKELEDEVDRYIDEKDQLREALQKVVDECWNPGSTLSDGGLWDAMRVLRRIP